MPTAFWSNSTIFRLTSVASCKYIWIQRVLTLLSKSFVYNQFSASPGYTSLLYTDGEGIWGFLSSSQQTALYLTQNYSLLPLFVTDVVLKTRSRESNSQKASDIMNCPFQKRAGEWGEFRPAKASGIGTRDRVSCLQKKRSEFELFTQIFFYILLKCQSITAVCLDSPTAIEISLLDLSFIACQRT